MKIKNEKKVITKFKNYKTYKEKKLKLNVLQRSNWIKYWDKFQENDFKYNMLIEFGTGNHSQMLLKKRINIIFNDTRKYL